MRIAVAQILSGTNPADNLQLVRDYTGRAADAGATLVVFPEATMCRFGVPLAPIAEPVDGPWADGVRTIAAEANITVVAGMFTPADHGRVANTLLAVGPGTPNQPDTHYDKIHLYDAFGFTESRTVAPGREPVVITVGGVDVGLTTCYDLRFPELFTTLARRGAELIIVSASWAAGPGKLGHWTARATSSRQGRPTPANRWPRAHRPGSAAAWWFRRSATWWSQRKPTRSYWSPTSPSSRWRRRAGLSRC
jgi:predicted amidohydrolase